MFYIIRLDDDLVARSYVELKGRTVASEDLYENGGNILIKEYPIINQTYLGDDNWEELAISEEANWFVVRDLRKKWLISYDEKISQYNRDVRLGNASKYDITVLDNFAQILCDITEDYVDDVQGALDYMQSLDDVVYIDEDAANAIFHNADCTTNSNDDDYMAVRGEMLMIGYTLASCCE